MRDHRVEPNFVFLLLHLAQLGRRNCAYVARQLTTNRRERRRKMQLTRIVDLSLNERAERGRHGFDREPSSLSSDSMTLASMPRLPARICAHERPPFVNY